MEENDQARLWGAIDWKGQIIEDPSNLDSKPSDEQFKEYFEQIFNPPDVDSLNLDDFHSDVTIPILDDPITPDEVQNQVKRLKRNKAGGPDGLPPRFVQSVTF